MSGRRQVYHRFTTLYPIDWLSLTLVTLFSSGSVPSWSSEIAVLWALAFSFLPQNYPSHRNEARRLAFGQTSLISSGPAWPGWLRPHSSSLFSFSGSNSLTFAPSRTSPIYPCPFYLVGEEKQVRNLGCLFSLFRSVIVTLVEMKCLRNFLLGIILCWSDGTVNKSKIHTSLKKISMNCW